ncbi:hypothetical protein HMPREF9080_01845 [Cardiobacterium valvarum F0432]|uniref:Uncharacterized protein n=1 Tax=Cardiobacterium valvarum F0432 TaxID=797473 RepID=G9ZGE3_9GAMM|nr:hypothetical protein HMPREF9080_01845 [Cardiobacterium valvarum F0432]
MHGGFRWDGENGADFLGRKVPLTRDTLTPSLSRKRARGSGLCRQRVV